ncbi:MAG: nuclear transport factor 2 family protein [Myxococcota bacterium]
MTRLGPYRPTTVEARLDRMESLAAIRQLAFRYALCLDTRDIDALVRLFPEDVRVGRDDRGRAALHRWFSQTMREMRTSIHLIGNHVVDFDDADHARGVVQVRDELERPEQGLWQVGVLQYWDRYVRIDGEWYFERRKFHRYYVVDALERPRHGAGLAADPLTTTQLPEAFPSWGAFWKRMGDEER